MQPSHMIFAGAGALTLLAAVTDLKAHRIPNWLTVPAALAALAYHGLAPGGMGVAAALCGLAVGFGLLLLPFLMGGGGMGDVKLLAALGAWLGPQLLLAAFVLSIVLAAVMAIGVLMFNAARLGLSRTKKRFLANARSGAAPQAAPRRVLPFAVPVALGTWLLLAWFVGQNAT